MADQRGGLADLRHQAYRHQRLDVMGEGGGRDLQFLLQAPNRQPGSAGADQHAVDFEPGWITQGFEMCGGVV